MINSHFVFLDLDRYIDSSNDLLGGCVLRSDTSCDHYMAKQTEEEMQKILLGASQVHLAWMLLQPDVDLEDPIDPDDWGRYLKERGNSAFFETVYEFPKFRVRVVSVSTAYMLICAYRLRRGSSVPKSVHRNMRKLLKRLVPAPKSQQPRLRAI